MYKKNTTNTRTHKLSKIAGSSYGIVLPIDFVRHLGWRERQELDITLDGGKLIIKDWKK